MADLKPELIERAKLDRGLDYRLSLNQFIMHFGIDRDTTLIQQVTKLFDERTKMIQMLTDEQRAEFGIFRWNICNG